MKYSVKYDHINCLTVNNSLFVDLKRITDWIDSRNVLKGRPVLFLTDLFSAFSTSVYVKLFTSKMRPHKYKASLA